MAYYIGIDGGGTKTRCVLADDRGVIASAVSGGSNIVRLGDARVRESLHDVIHRVCATAEIAPRQINKICIGASGAGRAEAAARIQQIVAEIDSQLSPARIHVVGDTVITLHAAFGSGPGVIAIAGTGSIIYGRDLAGATIRAGGYGFAISDEGSGQWIGRNAIAAALLARDQLKKTSLTSAVLETCNLSHLDALVDFANATPPPEFPRLFPVVLRAAEAGDAIANELLTRAGTELAKLAGIVVSRIASSCPSPPNASMRDSSWSAAALQPSLVPVAITGSVFRQSAQVRHVFYNQLKACFPRAELQEGFVEPVMGALALARSATAQLG